MGKYHYKLINDRYIIYNGKETLRTPGGKPVGTLYLPLADRIIHDLEAYGYNFHSASSILSWHFTMLDNFAEMDHAMVEYILMESFLWNDDWTCTDYSDKKWTSLFGDWDDRRIEIQEWLRDCSVMQLTAACCIGNAYQSLNLAFVLASLMEKHKGEERHSALQCLAELCARDYRNGSASEIMQDFLTFDLYYGIHLTEDGPILKNNIDIDITEDDCDLNDIWKEPLAVDTLVGRNFYHYTNSVIDCTQPSPYSFPDFKVESEEALEADGSNEGNDVSELSEFLPEECWIKRFVDEDDPNTCYLLYITLDEDGAVDLCECLIETTQRMGGGGFSFMIPGMELPSTKSYDCEDYPPKNVLTEIRQLMSKRILPQYFSFVGKRLPQAMVDAGGNSGSNTEYSYALQSAFRLAYMHMSIDTDENGIIKALSYSSYQSSGSGYGDMFSRPISYPDRSDEAIDMLLHIIDQCSEEEYRQMTNS